MHQSTTEPDCPRNPVKPLLNMTSDHQPANEVIRQVFEKTALSVGDDFFKTLTRNLSQVLGVPYVILARLEDDGMLHSLAFWNEDHFSDLECYDPDIAPCGVALKDGSYFCARDVQQLFPKDQDLITLQAQGYFGMALRDSGGRVIGNLYVIDRRPIEDPTLYRSVLAVFGMRAAAEIEREQQTQKIQSLNESNTHLYSQEKEKSKHLASALERLEKMQVKLVQAEKSAALGQLLAGVAHEVNNPIGCIIGNIEFLQSHTQDLRTALALYQEQSANLDSSVQQVIEELELEFVLEDLPKVMTSVEASAIRVREITQSLRNYSRSDCQVKEGVNLHEGLDTTLLILRHRMKAKGDRPGIQVKKCYGDIPKISCCSGPVNQVFMNLLSNAIDAFDDANRDKTYQQLEENPNVIEVKTTFLPESERVQVTIADNGPGMSEVVRDRIFQAFFTTKPEGKGTGLGLSISWDIVTEMHQGQMRCLSKVGEGTQFVVELPQQRAG